MTDQEPTIMDFNPITQQYQVRNSDRTYTHVAGAIGWANPSKRQRFSDTNWFIAAAIAPDGPVHLIEEFSANMATLSTKIIDTKDRLLLKTVFSDFNRTASLTLLRNADGLTRYAHNRNAGSHNQPAKPASNWQYFRSYDQTARLLPVPKNIAEHPDTELTQLILLQTERTLMIHNSLAHTKWILGQPTEIHAGHPLAWALGAIVQIMAPTIRSNQQPTTMQRISL